MEQTDRRVRRTQKALGDALLALALEKEYESVTIQHITDRAAVGYRTFFLHYAVKVELLEYVLRNVRMEMRELMSPPPKESLLDPNASYTSIPESTLLFQHVQENSDLYKVLLFSNRGLVQPLKAFAIQEFKTNFGSLVNTDIPIDIITNHMVSGMITLVRWWLENDMSISPEEMGDYSFRLIIQPIRNMVLQSISK